MATDTCSLVLSGISAAHKVAMHIHDIRNERKPSFRKFARCAASRPCAFVAQSLAGALTVLDIDLFVVCATHRQRQI